MFCTVQRKYSAIVLCFCLLLFLNCCKKSPKNDPIPLTWENHEGVDVNIDLYGSEQDYLYSTNKIMSARAPAFGEVAMRGSELTTGKWYYIDVYSDDYTYNNWTVNEGYNIGSDSTMGRRFKHNGRETRIVAVTLKSFARYSILNNTGVESTWTSVGALDLETGEDIWMSLSAKERYAKLKMSKDHTGKIYYIEGVDTTSMNFTFNGISGYPQYTILAQETGLLFFFVNTIVHPTISLYQPTTIDSGVALINGNLYVMKKEK